MFLSPIILVVASVVYAVYSYFSIRGRTAGLWWHLCQWLSAFLFVGSGWLFGMWTTFNFNWGDFGWVMIVAIQAVTFYKIILYLMLKRY